MPPVTSDGTVDYDAINSGMADFSLISNEQYAAIDWAQVDFTNIAASPASADSLDYGLINYSKVSSAEDFAALAGIMQYDEITGLDLAAIAANPLSQGAFQVVIGNRGETMREPGSALNDLFRVRSDGKLVANGGDGRDLYYASSKSFEMVIKDLAVGDLVSLARFNDRDVRKGRLQLFQDGASSVVAFKGQTLVTLRNTDASALGFSDGNLFLVPPQSTALA